MGIRELRLRLGDTQSKFAERYGIPFRTIQNWETGMRIPPEYIIRLLEERIAEDLVNRKTAALPKRDSRKYDLPKRKDFIGSLSWLKAVRDVLGDNIVFALDDALMCQGSFGGRNDEYIVWVYGEEKVAAYNGVVILGNQISQYCVREMNGLKFTNFNRTLNDALANERILDMQGITEALSEYYYVNDESFDGIYVSPEYQERFDRLANEAMDYYSE